MFRYTTPHDEPPGLNFLLYSHPPPHLVITPLVWPDAGVTERERDEGDWRGSIHFFKGYQVGGGWGIKTSITPAGKVCPRINDNENDDDDII